MELNFLIQESWRIISAAGILLGIPIPAFSTALAFYDGFRCEVLPANLIQVERKSFYLTTTKMIHNLTDKFSRPNVIILVLICTN